MTDRNTVELEQYLSSVDVVEGEWAIFESSLDKDELIERVLQNKAQVIVELLADDPQNEYHLEALIALAGCALYDGEAMDKADDDFIEAIQECEFFKKMMEQEKDAMFGEWIENDWIDDD